MSLLSLPTELLEMIASHTDKKSLKAMRRASKVLHDNSRDTWKKRFSSIRTNLSSADLSGMVADFTRDRELATHVRKLSIAARLDPATGHTGVGIGFPWPRQSGGNLDNGPVSTLPGYEMLVWILRHVLPNCRSFEIKSAPPSIYYLTSSDVVYLIQLLLSDAGLSDVKMHAPLGGDAWAYTPGPTAQDLLPVGAVNRPLSLQGSRAWSSVKEVALYGIPDKLVQEGWLKEFLELASNIENLALECLPKPESRRHSYWSAVNMSTLQVLWLKQTSLDMSFLGTPAAFGNLKSLSLVSILITVYSGVFITFLSNLPTVAPRFRYLRLQSVVARTFGSGVTFEFSDLPGVREDTRWRDILRGNHTVATQVENDWRSTTNPALCCTLGSWATNKPTKYINSIKYEGDSMAEMMSALAQHVRTVRFLGN